MCPLWVGALHTTVTREGNDDDDDDDFSHSHILVVVVTSTVVEDGREEPSSLSLNNLGEPFGHGSSTLSYW